MVWFDRAEQCFSRTRLFIHWYSLLSPSGFYCLCWGIHIINIVFEIWCVFVFVLRNITLKSGRFLRWIWSVWRAKKDFQQLHPGCRSAAIPPRVWMSLFIVALRLWKGPVLFRLGRDEQPSDKEPLGCFDSVTQSEGSSFFHSGSLVWSTNKTVCWIRLHNLLFSIKPPPGAKLYLVQSPAWLSWPEVQWCLKKSDLKGFPASFTSDQQPGGGLVKKNKHCYVESISVLMQHL